MVLQEGQGGRSEQFEVGLCGSGWQALGYRGSLVVPALAWVMKGYLWGCCVRVKEEGGWVLALDCVVCTSKTCAQARCLLSLGISSSGMSKHHHIQNHKP